MSESGTIHRRWRARLILLVLVIAGGVFWSGYHKTPLPADQGDSLQGTPARLMTDSRPLRIGTFNINGCASEDDHYDPDRTADEMRGCDLVGLCEVHGRTLKIPFDQAHLLGEKLGMAYLFAPAERRWWHDDFGNGILCNLPVEHWQRFPMSTAASNNNRALLLVRVAYAGKTVNVLIVHIEGNNLPSGREGDGPQLHEALELFKSLAEPAILLGDLNTRSDHPILKAFLSDKRNVDALAQCPDQGHRVTSRIDWIFARGMRCVTAGIVDKGASDHPFYWADLELPPR